MSEFLSPNNYSIIRRDQRNPQTLLTPLQPTRPWLPLPLLPLPPPPNHRPLHLRRLPSRTLQTISHLHLPQNLMLRLRTPASALPSLRAALTDTDVAVGAAGIVFFFSAEVRVGFVVEDEAGGDVAEGVVDAHFRGGFLFLRGWLEGFCENLFDD